MKPYRVIISTPSLNIEVWTDLYRFIDSIYTNDIDENKADALHCLKERCIQVWRADESDTDVYKLDGQELTDEECMLLPQYTCYSILYLNRENTEEYTGLAPFVFFLRRFIFKDDNGNIASLVSLGIGTDGIKNQGKVNSFYYKCSNFFLLYDIPETVLGEKTIYFFFPTAKIKTKVLAGTGKDTDYQGDPNRRFFPLLEITEENYHSIFTTLGNDASKQAKDYTYVNESLNLIKNRILKNRVSKFTPITDYSDSLFGQWLINGYFNSYEDNELTKMSPDDIKELIQTLQIYRISIFELIQNIIFHGGKSGLFYCVFDKKENVSSFYQNKLPDLGNKASKVNRFLRVGIYDYHLTGIAGSFKDREKKANTNESDEAFNDLSLIDFFDIDSIATLGITQLDMRYAARLGIKSFVKTVFKHKGYFSVESNEPSEGHRKKRLTTIWNNGVSSFHSSSIDFAPGTHYEIILPVIPAKNQTIYSPQIQRNSILNFRQTLENQISSNDPIIALDFDFDKAAMISNCTTKQQQIDAIMEIGNDIIKRAGSGRNQIALNLKGKDLDHKLVFKILAYLQLKAENGFRKIILINGKDDFVSDFCELINPLLSDSTNDDIPVWNNDAAIILMSEKLQVQIICGATRGELYSLNQEYRKYYCNNFTEKDNLRFNLAKHNSNSPIDNIPKDFILPYDILIESSNGTTPFETYSLELLKRKIISHDLGFLVNHENTYIGNKIIVRNYYEADLMFQNSFFAERYAFLIAKRICKLKRKELVLIGYQQYSEYLLKAIKRIINEKSVHIAIATTNDVTSKENTPKSETTRFNRASKISKCESASKEIVNIEKYSREIDLSFNFDIDGLNSELRERILKSPEQFQFATIVPIGATLSTNDKIVALFKLWHKLQNFPQRESTNIDFIYNHCVIIVRDTIEPKITALEVSQQWKAIQPDQHLIETNLRNAKEIHYTIQIAKANIKADSATNNNWLKRLNDEISFPENWEEEKYVNFTENTSINSQNLMGFPKVDFRDESQHQEELARLFDFRNDIYKGHFDAFNSHHKYFFDTESFVRRRKKRFVDWLTDIKTHFQNEHQQNKLNIIITPNAETESDLVCNVNDYVFDGNALIVYLDVKNWRNNIVHKLSFFKYIDKANVSFHYVDHILLTGETYHRTKSYLYSIIDDQYESNLDQDLKTQDNDKQEKKIKGQSNQGKNSPPKDNHNCHNGIFDSIITVINRLPYTKCKEIKNDVSCNFQMKKQKDKNDIHNPDSKNIENLNVDIHFFAFINLYYPTSKLDGRECELCKLQRYYDDLSKKTVLDSCKRVINNNVEKLTIKSRKEIEQCRDNSVSQKSDRDFLRLVMTHELYYRISQISWGKEQFYDSTRDIIYKEFENIYNLLSNCEISPIKSSINDHINYWFKHSAADANNSLRKFFYKKLETDKKISFLKVISSPPLSKYIIIRQYAQSKLLSVLYEILHKKDENEYTYDDLIIVKSILKSLSFLKSNALVRKDVIERVWTVLGRVHNSLRREINEITNLIAYCDELITSYEDKQQKYKETGHFIPILEKRKQELNEYIDYFKKEKKHLGDLITKDEIIKDFSRDFQFFIKNAIVEDDAKATFLGELLRQGVEMRFDCNDISISATQLISIKNNQTAVTNDLFEYFSRKGLPCDSFFNIEYTNFLVWLFYDNTTIIRKTMANFSMELKKDSSIYSYFYKLEEKREPKLKGFDKFKGEINRIITDYSKRIEREYYYASFKPYHVNGDDINYVEKLIYVTYAKFKLQDLIVKKHKISIESDLKELLEVFSMIMGADAAFFTMKKGKRLYPIKFTEGEWKYNDWILDNYHTKRYNLVYPITPLFDLPDLQHGERGDLGAHSLVIYNIIDYNNETKATITFLYKEKKPLTIKESVFRINTQESGRLLLLLKNDIHEYVINYLINDKVFDLWLEKHKDLRIFNKIYTESNHAFNSVYDEMEEFEKIGREALKLTYRTWFFLTNETISFFYSNIERNRTKSEKDPKHSLSIDESYVIDTMNTLGQTFSENFVFIVSRLLDDRWNGNDEPQKNTILINGQDIHDFKSLDVNLIDAPIRINRHLLRTFITQCLYNSLETTSGGHGHRNWGEIKRIDITITESYIKLLDNFIDYFSFEDLMNEVNLFKVKKKHIQKINCDEYSSTTLTTLQGTIYYMNQHDNPLKNCPYMCEYGFDENNNFYVIIKFK